MDTVKWTDVLMECGVLVFQTKGSILVVRRMALVNKKNVREVCVRN